MPEFTQDDLYWALKFRSAVGYANFLGDWAPDNMQGGDTSLERMCREYQIDPKALEDCEILMAYYCYEDYSGSSMVVYIQNGTLYEVNASHCSCNGLEGQWEPEETSAAAILDRLKQTYCSIPDECQKVLKAILVDEREILN